MDINLILVVHCNKILELSPNFRTDEHNEGIRKIIKARLRCTGNDTFWTR